MINFNHYTERFLEIKLKNQHQKENFEDTIYGLVYANSGLAPKDSSVPKSEIFNTNPHSCLFVKFKSKKYLFDGNYNDSQTIGLDANEVDEINII